ncbi:MAG: hypothetical protein K2N47_00470, partial [Clostridia bacterium]|nr:hypothetical protein [Clostridia bacterium]
VPNSYNYKKTVDATCFKLKNNTGEKIMNAGKYQCSVDFVDDARNLSKNYNLRVIDGAYIEATIEAVNVSVTLLNYDGSPTGAASFEFNNREFSIDMLSSVIAVEPSKSSVKFGIDDVDWSKVKLSIFTRKGTDISNYVYTETELKNGGEYFYNLQITDEQYKKNVKMVCANGGYATILVTARNLDVEIRNITHVYDGTNYKFDAYTAITYIGENPSGLTKDDFYIKYISVVDEHPETLIDMDASQIVAGETQGYVVALKGVNAGNYTIIIDNPEVSTKGGNTSPDRAKFDYAVYFVLKYTLNVTTASQEYTYDGNEHSCLEFTYSDLPSKAFSVEYIESTANTKVRNYTEGDGEDNVFAIKIYKKSNPEANFAEYFNIIYNYGKLKVNKRHIQLTLPEVSSQYS